MYAIISGIHTTHLHSSAERRYMVRIHTCSSNFGICPCHTCQIINSVISSQNSWDFNLCLRNRDCGWMQNTECFHQILLEGIIGTLKYFILYPNTSPGFVLVLEFLIVTHFDIMSETGKGKTSLSDLWSKQTNEAISKALSTIPTNIQPRHEVTNVEFSLKMLICTSKFV